MSSTTTRLSAAERREAILDAALIEFAERGWAGTSTEDIARRAGISQPYLFRLFGTKKELFKASVARCLRETLEMFQRAAEGKRGEAALKAIGQAYMDEMLTGDRVRLRAQMQAYVACDDPDICQVVRDGYGDLVAYAERVSGLPPQEISRFFATGMLLNVLASMQVIENPDPWAQTLLEGCGKELQTPFFHHGGSDDSQS
jgi:AcrR family transcriptional regulator